MAAFPITMFQLFIVAVLVAFAVAFLGDLSPAVFEKLAVEADWLIGQAKAGRAIEPGTLLFSSDLRYRAISATTLS